MQSIRQVERLNQAELEKCVPSNASWHTDYRDTAYIYIGGLPFELSEGDILTIFSQYGNPVHINLVRDKDTGKSRGFCFLKYEDQRSCDLAVDNLSGAGVMGRVISVDHTRYKKKDGEIEGVGDEELEEEETEEAKELQEGNRRKRRRTSESASDGDRPLIKEEIALAKLIREHDDDDPMKAYLVKEKKEEVAEALKALAKHRSKDKRSERSDPDDAGTRDRHRHRSRHHHHRSRRHDESSAADRDHHRSRYRDDASSNDEEDRRRTTSRRQREHEGDRQRRRDNPDARAEVRRDRSPSSDRSDSGRDRRRQR